MRWSDYNGEEEAADEKFFCVNEIENVTSYPLSTSLYS